jgi:iron complex outermembrane receptor protein
VNPWSRYDFASTVPGFAIGAGVTYVSDQAGNVPTAASPKLLTLPAYTVADLVFYYRFQRLDFALKIGNVFDKVYWDSVGSTLADLSVVPGAPRNLTLSVRIPF